MRKGSSSLTETKVKDPVCGMTVDPTAARGGSFTYQGVEYFFCNPKCNERFRSAPAHYLSPNFKPGGMAAAPTLISPVLLQPLKPAPAQSAPTEQANTQPSPAQPSSTPQAPAAHPAAVAAPATAYVCPMCPEVRSAQAGGLSFLRHGSRTGDSAGCVSHRVRLPHAPRGCTGSSRLVPHCAAWRWSRARSPPRTSPVPSCAT